MCFTNSILSCLLSLLYKSSPNTFIFIVFVLIGVLQVRYYQVCFCCLCFDCCFVSLISSFSYVSTLLHGVIIIMVLQLYSVGTWFVGALEHYIVVELCLCKQLNIFFPFFFVFFFFSIVFSFLDFYLLHVNVIFLQLWGARTQFTLLSYNFHYYGTLYLCNQLRSFSFHCFLFLFSSFQHFLIFLSIMCRCLLFGHLGCWDTIYFPQLQDTLFFLHKIHVIVELFL
jgi:hypothetical protein